MTTEWPLPVPQDLRQTAEPSPPRVRLGITSTSLNVWLPLCPVQGHSGFMNNDRRTTLTFPDQTEALWFELARGEHSGLLHGVASSFGSLTPTCRTTNTAQIHLILQSPLGHQPCTGPNGSTWAQSAQAFLQLLGAVAGDKVLALIRSPEGVPSFPGGSVAVQ